jgi:DNA-binding response OmpR family regulator
MRSKDYKKEKKSYLHLPNESSSSMTILILHLHSKRAFEDANRIGGNKISFQVNTYNDPFLALSGFKPDYYDLMLIGINMSKMNGFDFCVKALEIDVNPRFCFMSSGLINQEALRDQYPSLSIGCFIKKPVTIENLVRRVKSELE